MSKVEAILNQWITDTNEWHWPAGFSRPLIHPDGRDDLRGAHCILCDLRTALDRQRASRKRKARK